MYDVTLINLASDARTVAPEPTQLERRGIGDVEMQALLEGLSRIDPVENAAAEPELRVRVRTERYLIRAGQKQLVLYDMLNRDLPGHPLSVVEVMAELDGSAAAARLQASATRAAFLLEAAAAREEELVAVPRVPINRRRVAVLASLTALFAAGLGYLHWPIDGEEEVATFHPLTSAQAAEAQAALAGVYLTGTEPGSHGIALTQAGELRLFEMRSIDAPRLLQAGYEVGLVEGALCLATDQPGGRILQSGADALLYCGETYRRVP